MNDHIVHRTGTSEEIIQVNDIKRSYLLHLPSSYSKEKQIPLVLAFHGGGGQGKGMERLTGFSSLSDLNSFIVVYPDALWKQWNDGREVKEIRSQRENIDDVSFVSALIDRLEQVYSLDPRRIYATGISNGGFFSQRLACELSNKIAAIAVVASSLPRNLSSCKPERPVSVLIISGTNDPLVPWEGGGIGLGLRNHGQVLSAYDTVKYWATQNSCSLSPETNWMLDKDPNDGIRVRKEVYGQGSHGTEVVLYAVEGGGHTWPGSIQYLPRWIIGRLSMDIDASEIVWDFFLKHPMR